MSDEQIPEGYLKDSRGRLVPLSMIKAQDKLKDDEARALVTRAIKLRDELRQLRADTIEHIGDLQNLLFQEYGAKIGGDKGNITVATFDGSMKVEIAMQDNLELGPEIQAAKALIDEFLEAETQTASEAVRVLVLDAFQVRKKGRIDTHRVIALQHLDIPDESGKWAEAMRAIKDAIRTQSRSQYVRFYHREKDGGPALPVVLDIAKL